MNLNRPTVLKSDHIVSGIALLCHLGSNLLFWSERRCADGFVESAVGHYFWYFSTLVLVVLVVVVTTVAKLA